MSNTPNATYSTVGYNYSTNATVPVQALVSSLTNLGTNIDLSLVPAGTGAVQLCIPDGTTTGGNKRGNYSVDLQGASQRSAATQVASGANSFAAGNNNTASANTTIAMGYSNTSSGANSATIGGHNTASGIYSFTVGYSNTASASYSAVFGNSSVASGTSSTAIGAFCTTNSINGQVAIGFYSPTIGKFQNTITQLYAITTSTTAKVATSDGNSGATTNQLVLRSNAATRVRLFAVARDATNNTDAKEWTSDILLTKGSTAASIAIVGSPTVTSTFATSGASGWSLAVSTDTTNGGLAVTVTSSTTDTVDWNVILNAVEVM